MWLTPGHVPTGELSMRPVPVQPGTERVVGILDSSTDNTSITNTDSIIDIL